MSHAIGAYLTDVFVTRLDWLVLLGFVAQALFTTRFLVQWIASERAGHSVIPVAFWLFSIGGSLLLLIYSLYRRDIVFIGGQAAHERRGAADSGQFCEAAGTFV